MLRIFIRVYALVSLAMIATSLYTGHRATALSGKPHYMLTRTTVSVMEEVPPDNPGDAAFDQAQREAGDSTAIPVEKPCFVLGFADRTGPVILAGGLSVLVATWWSRRRKRGRAVGQTDPGQV